MNSSLLVIVLLLTIFVLYGVNGDKVKESVRDEKCGDDLTCSLSGDTMTVKGTGPMYDFTSSSVPWVDYKDDIINVVIDNGVSYIGAYAFSYCPNISQVSFPSTLISLGNSSFISCSSLTKISLPSSVEIIGSNAFGYCSLLSEANIPDNVKSIGDSAFYGTNLSQVTFPTTLRSIGACAFGSCSSLTHVVIPASLNSIGFGPFSFCSSLSSIDVEEGNSNYKSVDGVLYDSLSTTLIQYPAGMTKNSYVIPNTVKSIGNGAFARCEHLVSVTIPTSVTVLEPSSFNACVNLKNINIPSSVTSIGNGAFASCKSLTSISIPSGVQTIGAGGFFECTGLTHIDLPDTISSIEGGTFTGCSSLTDIVIPSGVKLIDGGSLNDCVNLKNVTFMNGLESIRAGAFSNCPSLVDLIFPESLKSIGSGAFGSSGVSHITLPASVESIDPSAFFGCSNLSAVFYRGSNDFSSSAFPGCDSIKDVCVTRWYNSSTFCGLSVTRDHEICQTFQKLFSDCSLPAYSGDHFVEQKRKNTTEWESLSNGCMEYKCDSKYGFVSWSVCNSSDKLNRICVKNECVDEERVEKKAYVEIEMQEGVKVSEINVTEVVEMISTLCNISSDRIEIGYEVDSDGFILRITVYVSDEDAATIIMNALETMGKGKSCEAGVICRNKAIRIIIMSEQSLSLGARIEAIVMNILLLILFVVNHVSTSV